MQASASATVNMFVSKTVVNVGRLLIILAVSCSEDPLGANVLASHAGSSDLAPARQHGKLCMQLTE